MSIQSQLKFLSGKGVKLVDALFVFIIIVVFGIGSIYLSREKETIYVDLLFTGESVRDDVYQTSTFVWVDNRFNPGKLVKNTSGSTMGEVVGSEIYNYGGSRRFPKVKLKINVYKDKALGVYKIGDIPLLVGSIHTFDIDGTRYKGLITYYGKDANDPKIKEKIVSVDLKITGVEQWLVSSLESGFEVGEGEGVVFKIQSVQVFPSDSYIFDSSGVAARVNGSLVDILIKATLKVKCVESECYYSGTVPIKVGGNFWFETDRLVIDKEKTKIIKIGDYTETN